MDLLKESCAKIFNVDAAALGSETNVKEDLHAKSVNIVQISAAIEDEYEVEVPYMELTKKKTLGDIAEFVDELMSM